MQQAEKSNLYFGDVEYVVLDEADTMFDKGFGPEVRAVLKPVRTKSQPAECILVLATLKAVGFSQTCTAGFLLCDIGSCTFFGGSLCLLSNCFHASLQSPSLPCIMRLSSLLGEAISKDCRRDGETPRRNCCG